MDKYLYFRSVTDQDADDGSADSIYVPAKAITGLVPTSVTALTIFFESMLNQAGNGTDDENVISDSIILTCTQGKVKQAMRDIVNAINSNKLYNDGVITVADDVTTTYLTSSAAADETVSAQYLGSSITACATITVAAVLS
jgi:hypothetical protein|tara:strand:+ start:607 stop:1029 length:423 start_codon:yes stop_codon:yes gene_type:complete